MARSLRTAACALALSVTLGVTPAFASTTISPANPGGIASPTSPNGVPGAGVGPEFHTFVAARTYATAHLGSTPGGANDFSCRPKAGQRPIVLIPGTGEDAFSTWAMYAPQLAASGYCVFTFNYNPQISALTGKTMDDWPFTGDIRSSAAFMAGFVDRVLAATGSDKVTLIGHSQGGGPLPRSYLKWYGGATKVDQVIGIVPSNHGTTAYGINTLYLALGPNRQDSVLSAADSLNMTGWAQQLSASSFMADLNAGGDTVAGVRYTVITTVWDQVVVPYASAYLRGDNVTNILVQDRCPLDAYTHLNATYDPVAFQYVRNALDPENSRPVRCVWIPPYVV